MENFVEKTFEETEAMTAKELFEYRTAEIEHKTKEIVAAAESAKAAEVAKENPDAERIAKMEKTIEANYITGACCVCHTTLNCNISSVSKYSCPGTNQHSL